MPATLATTCPHCRQSVAAEEPQLLRKVVCPKCQFWLVSNAMLPPHGANPLCPRVSTTLNHPGEPEALNPVVVA